MTIKSLLLLSTIILFLVACGPKMELDEYLNKFSNQTDVNKQAELLTDFANDFPQEKEKITQMVSAVAGRYLQNNELDKAINILDNNKENASTRIFNGIAWTLFEQKSDLEKAKNLAASGVEKAREELNAGDNNKPENVSSEDWKLNNEQQLAMVLDTYANIQKELGEKENALESFKESVELTSGEIPELNGNYVTSIIEAGDLDLAKDKMEEFITNGTSSTEMKTQLEEIYVKQGGTNFSAYYGELHAKARDKMIQTLKEEMINTPAADFTLQDLDGKTVNLSDYKGKVVILDFWATWCQPCLQSFPAMKIAVEKYENDKNVKFLFTNTWERVENPLENAKKFIAQNNYPFHVLVDDKNEAIAKYDVQGIPTKFIIDKDQNIRFKSVGFSGNIDEVVEELDIMISMLK